MRNRFLILDAVLLVAAFVAGLVVLHAWTQTHAPGRFIDREHCDRIKKGMAQGEVEAILGGPPGTYSKKRVLFLDTQSYSMLGAGERVELWTGDGGRVGVIFDEQGAVEHSEFEEGTEWRGPSLLQQVLDWLRSSAPPPSSHRSPKTFATQPESPPSSP
jgi:hypothetical protein